MDLLFETVGGNHSTELTIVIYEDLDAIVVHSGSVDAGDISDILLALAVPLLANANGIRFGSGSGAVIANVNVGAADRVLNAGRLSVECVERSGVGGSRLVAGEGVPRSPIVAESPCVHHTPRL